MNVSSVRDAEMCQKTLRGTRRMQNMENSVFGSTHIFRLVITVITAPQLSKCISHLTTSSGLIMSAHDSDIPSVTCVTDRM